MRQQAGPAPVLLGVDAPIGLPEAYARAWTGRFDGFRSFLGALPLMPEFFAVCADIGDVSPRRPFYPLAAKRGVSASAHREALGILERDGMLRRCERARDGRPAASPLFWTLGAKQVGKAALVLWHDLLRAGTPPAALWPFDGDLHELLATRAVTVAETYPAEAMRQLGLRLSGGKRNQAARRGLAGQLRTALSTLEAEPVPDLEQAVADGFGADSKGEDKFDCLVGLLGMLQVIRDPGRDRVPEDNMIRRWEGWILGQAEQPVQR